MNRERARQIIEISQERYRGAHGILKNYASDSLDCGNKHPDGISFTEENYIRKLIKESRHNFSFTGVINCLAAGYSEWDILRGHAHSGFMKVKCDRYPLVNIFMCMRPDNEGQYYIEDPGGRIDHTCSFDSVNDAGAYYYIKAARTTYKKEQLASYSLEKIIDLGQTVVHGHGR